MAQPDEAPPDPGVRNQRARRYRRRLRSRIILSFLLLSFTLTALFAVERKKQKKIRAREKLGQGNIESKKKKIR